MIHKIKALHNEGAGLSIRSIACQLGISRNTVRKYLRMDEAAIGEQQSNRTRHKQLDDYRDYIVTLLGKFPHLSAVKVLRKLKERHPELGVSDRSARRYIKALKETVSLRQKRYYEPVKRVFDLVKDFGTSESPKSTRSSTTHWCPGRPGHPAFRHNIASSLRLHTGLPYDWTPRSDAPLGSPLAPSARRVSRVASRLPGTTRLRFALHGGQRGVANVRRHGTTGEMPRVRFERDEQDQLGPLSHPGHPGLPGVRRDPQGGQDRPALVAG